MYLSTSGNDTDVVNFHPVRVEGLTQLEDIIVNYNYSTALFKENYRENKAFEQAELVALDFDGGLTLAEAEAAFKDYKYIIGPTRNHQKEKNGIICDRFRVILFLDRPIIDPSSYRATILKLMDKFPAADKACKDPARYWAPCTCVYKSNDAGMLITPEPGLIVAPEPAVITSIRKGRLARHTLDFIALGAKVGEWNRSLFMAAKDCQEQGYSFEETRNLLKMATRTELGNDGDFDDKDDRTIESAFANDPVHPPRGVDPESAFQFKTIKDLYTEKPETDWLVNGMFETGAISIIAGPPKMGKSTIIRQLAKCVALGEPFLDREVKPGQVIYMAMEENERMLYEQFKRQGLTEDANLLYHIGPALRPSAEEEFKEFVLQQRPRLVVLDTLVMFANIEDNNSYKEVYGAITSYRNLARESGAHIVCVHHQNKSPAGGNNSVMGSVAFTGAVDAIVLFTGYNRQRFITTSGRGLDIMVNHEVLFDKETQSYTLGFAQNEEF